MTSGGGGERPAYRKKPQGLADAAPPPPPLSDAERLANLADASARVSVYRTMAASAASEAKQYAGTAERHLAESVRTSETGTEITDTAKLVMASAYAERYTVAAEATAGRAATNAAAAQAQAAAIQKSYLPQVRRLLPAKYLAWKAGAVRDAARVARDHHKEAHAAAADARRRLDAAIREAEREGGGS